MSGWDFFFAAAGLAVPIGLAIIGAMYAASRRFDKRLDTIDKSVIDLNVAVVQQNTQVEGRLQLGSQKMEQLAADRLQDREQIESNTKAISKLDREMQGLSGEVRGMTR